jgi:large subunit ribosomal protein L29
MKIVEIRKLDIQKLNESLAELRNKGRELRFSIANNQLSAVRDLRKVKKDIAKILTVLNEKRLDAEKTKTTKTKEVKEVKKEKK